MIDVIANDHNSVLLIGGTDAGKSNFLFRLWIAIDRGAGALVKNGLPSEIEYLRAGAEHLLEGDFAGHTSKEVHERVVVPVKSSAPGVAPSGTLVLPDVNGEQVLAIYRNRQWSREWEDMISQRCACLLFVRAGSSEIVAPLDWVTCFEKYGSQVEHAGHAGQIDDEPDDDDRAVEVPTQVVLIEWLQFLRRAFTRVVGPAFRPRIGVIVSAWDAVPLDQQSTGPMQYLNDNLPMLSQFIEGNSETFEFQTFGVSIVAGDLKSDEDFREEYLNGSPPEFGYIIHSISGSLTRSPDITLPIAWALRFLQDGA